MQPEQLRDLCLREQRIQDCEDALVLLVVPERRRLPGNMVRLWPRGPQANIVSVNTLNPTFTVSAKADAILWHLDKLEKRVNKDAN